MLAWKQFADFFREAHRDPNTGKTFDPFPWQLRLAERVCRAQADTTGAWPDVLALPTGSGKTTCIDIAVFALACQATQPACQRTAPRRILFVVDRRVIVDEAFEHAERLARRLYFAESGILKRVADELRKLAGSDIPLTCHQLRGGMYRDDAWARTPSQPCVIASTVDQIGSRLLFRAYGRSFKAWPVYAGLAGNDALILLDEAHCATPFLQTVRSVATYRQAPWAERPACNPFQIVVLSATPPPECGEVFSVDDSDRQHHVLGARLNASKPVRLVVATKARGANALRELATSLVEQAIRCLSQERQAVAIVVNRVQTAKLVDELLGALKVRDGRHEPSGIDSRIVRSLRRQLDERGILDFDHVVMTGRMRPIDRQKVAQKWLRLLDARSAPARRLERPVFVTATQCLEVGANLDFDVMVSECASFDALRQRFGRLNRTGRSIKAVGSIVIRQDQALARVPDGVYGNALCATWEQLNKWAVHGEVDFGVSVIDGLWSQLASKEQAQLIPPATTAPIMLPAYLDCWVQTSPEPEPTPDVSIFLHGVERAAPEVQVCWRADLPPHSGWPSAEDVSSMASQFERDVIDVVSLCPPTASECLSVPRHLFLRWWQELADHIAEELTDVESAFAPSQVGEAPQGQAIGLLWRGPRDSQLLRRPADLRPGDTIVLPSSVGGWDVLGHVPLEPGESIDVAEQAHWQARGTAVVRLRPEFLNSWPDTPDGARNALQEALQQLTVDADATPDRDELLAWLHAIVGQPNAPSWLREVVRQGLPVGSRPALVTHPFGGLVIRGRIRVPPATWISVTETFTTEDDSASATTQLTLQAHCEAVAKRAYHYAKRCHLDHKLATTLAAAGLLHDLGKADRRYQAFLFGGNRAVADAAGDIFAKSAGLRDNRHSYDDAWQSAKLPDEFRHEMLSMQLAERLIGQNPAFLEKAINELLHAGESASCDQPVKFETDVDYDLLLHLIASHHGYARPLAPVVMDQGQDEDLSVWFAIGSCKQAVDAVERRNWVPLHRLDSGVADRFWRLIRRYGWWGLAWLEAIFVLADHRTSEDEWNRATNGQNPTATKSQ